MSAIRAHFGEARQLMRLACRFVVGVRLHSAVLAACCGVPAVLLAYRDKARDDMQSMNQQGWMIEPDQLAQGTLLESVRHLDAAAARLRPLIHQPAAHWQHRLMAYGRQVSATLAGGAGT